MVKLLSLVIVTGLVANTTTTLLALYLLSSVGQTSTEDEDGSDEGEQDDEQDPEPTLASAGSESSRARRAERTAERILGYNPMCPTCGPAESEPPPLDEMPLDPANVELAGAQRSTLPLVVAATMESEDPALSVATLVDVEQGIGGLFGIGDQPSPGVEIIKVTTGVVHLINDGRLEYIPFGAEPPPPATPRSASTAKPEAPAPARNSSSIPGAEEAIACDDNGACVVDRAFVESLIAEPKLLVGQLRAAPSTTADGSAGFRLRGVRKGTLPDLLGLRSGDTITEVGGSPLTMDTLPGLFGKLRHASHIEVTVDRRGQRVSRQLEIRS